MVIQCASPFGPNVYCVLLLVELLYFYCIFSVFFLLPLLWPNNALYIASSFDLCNGSYLLTYISLINNSILCLSWPFCSILAAGFYQIINWLTILMFYCPEHWVHLNYDRMQPLCHPLNLPTFWWVKTSTQNYSSMTYFLDFKRVLLAIEHQTAPGLLCH